MDSIQKDALKEAILRNASFDVYSNNTGVYAMRMQLLTRATDDIITDFERIVNAKKADNAP